MPLNSTIGVLGARGVLVVWNNIVMIGARRVNQYRVPVDVSQVVNLRRSLCTDMLPVVAICCGQVTIHGPGIVKRAWAVCV